MSDIKDNIIYKAALTFKHEELAGMYAICNKREQDLQKENARLRESNSKLCEDIEHLKTFPWIKANSILSMKNSDLEHENARLREALEKITDLHSDDGNDMLIIAYKALE
jgi:predicted nuclease with TOPRIM domain